MTTEKVKPKCPKCGRELCIEFGGYWCSECREGFLEADE